MIKKDEWPPNSPDINPLDYHVWGAMLERYQVYSPKTRNLSELKNVLKTIWTDLPQGPINRAILVFRKRLHACVKVKGSHFEHFIWNWVSFQCDGTGIIVNCCWFWWAYLLKIGNFVTCRVHNLNFFVWQAITLDWINISWWNFAIVCLTNS